MNIRRPSLGPWIFGAVIVICCTILVCTGHEVAIAKALAVVVIACFIIFMCAML